MSNSSVEDKYFIRNKTIKLKDKLVFLDKPLIMGILNLTPDSFHQNSQIHSEKKFRTQVDLMISQGADIIDIGAFSTRPNAEFIDEKEELERLKPYLKLIEKHYTNHNFSLDTFRTSIAKVGMDSGIALLNDVSGGLADSALIDFCAENKLPYILMHGFHSKTKIHGLEDPFSYTDYLKFFSSKVKLLEEKGIHDIVLDPGFGFGKNVKDNYHILHHLQDLQNFQKPILVGVSRKSMLTKVLQIDTENALNATTIVNTIACMKGADILRVHDVKEAVEIRKILKQL